ncbi:MAG: carboxylesterase family protein [Butyrivibrio sp.]|nr:carboxylesterase family protein [Butyrivibrio sp.]
MAGYIIIALIYMIYLWLSKCTIIAWILGIISFCGYYIIKNKYFFEANKITRFFILIIFLVILFIISKIGAPPYKNVPAVDVNNPEVTDVIEVEQGKLTGVKNEEKTVEVYAGIPYAKAPVGDLRWKEPQEPEKWEGVLAADHFAPMSMQQRSSTIYNSLVDLVIYKHLNLGFKDNYLEPMSEDSLYLNIWKPEGDCSNLPVVFYIHGGSLMTGQPSYYAYNGETFAENGVIFISFGYRLNIFGYYANDELQEESENGTTGDYGLLDQIQALKWVNENIEAFGGDPNNITIAGESAGSSSVNAICVSPLAKGLFRRAIAESSGITAVEPYHTFRSMEEAKKMGQDILNEFSAKTVDDLRNISAEELVNTQFSNNSMTVDGYAITQQPYLTYLEGNNNEEALLNGFNAHEADVFNYFSGKITPENIVEKLSVLYGDYTQDVVDLYPSTNNKEAKESYNTILSATWFAYSHYDWTRYLANQGKPVYKYYFYKESAGLSNNHAGELPYVYGNLDKNPLAFNSSDEKLSEIMVSYWTNFAKTGNPNSNDLPIWEEYSNAENQVLGLSDNVEMMEDPYLKVYEIIDKYQNELK